MNKKIISIISTVFILAVAASVFTKAAHTSDYNWRGGVTEIETSYAGIQIIPNMSLDYIESIYGKDARSVYIECASSGDFYKFRSATGWWNSAISLEKGVQKLSKIQELESDAVSVLGPYATIQDYLSWAKNEGISSSSDMDRFAFDCITGKRPWPKKITEAEYLANHRNAKTVPAVANNAQVEALKTYKGNNAEFNAYVYYTRYADLQSAIGPNGDLLLKHYNEYGKKEQRIAK